MMGVRRAATAAEEDDKYQMSDMKIRAQRASGAWCDELSLDGGSRALVRDAAESHRFSPIIEWTLASWHDTCHVAWCDVTKPPDLPS
jgi:hypothetical protein